MADCITPPAVTIRRGDADCLARHDPASRSASGFAWPGRRRSSAAYPPWRSGRDGVAGSWPLAAICRGGDAPGRSRGGTPCAWRCGAAGACPVCSGSAGPPPARWEPAPRLACSLIAAAPGLWSVMPAGCSGAECASAVRAGSASCVSRPAGDGSANQVGGAE
jgi:hypothetical protein